METPNPNRGTTAAVDNSSSKYLFEEFPIIHNDIVTSPKIARAIVSKRNVGLSS